MKTPVRGIIFSLSAILPLLAAGLSGCATTLSSDATKAVAITMTAYDSAVQPAMLTYGQLVPCGAPTAKVICRDQNAWAKIKTADTIASAAAHKARLVIDGGADDTGTELQDAAKAIQDATSTLITAQGAH